MRGMSTSALVSVEEYLRRTEKPNAEYVDGVLYPKPMPTTPHARMQAILLTLLSRFGVEALPEVAVRLTPKKFRVPDVVAAQHIPSPYPIEPVLLCVEILSPEDGLGATLAKCEEYHAWGVPYCWVIDPVKRTAWEYPKDGEPTRMGDTGILKAGDVAVSLEELFAQLKA